MTVAPQVSSFFEAIAAWRIGYVHNTFSYVAIRVGDNFTIVQCRIFLSGEISEGYPFSHFKSENVRAGQYRLADLGFEAEELLSHAIEGKIKTPDGDLYFPFNPHSAVGYIYNTLHDEGLSTNRRLGVLTILGRQLDLRPRQPHLDWELKAAKTPYDTLQELMYEYRLGALRPDVVTLDVVALTIMVVDLDTRVIGTRAELAVKMVSGLAPQKASLGYRVIGGGSTVRGSLDGAALNWSLVDGGIRRGTQEISVPSAAVVHCYATYAGTVHSQGWIADPSVSQNAKRSAYEAFDPQLENLKTFIEKQGRGNARDLEAGVAWLLWMLGFSPAHLGGTAKTQEAADLLVTTPKGHFAVIECTTGLLKADNKLPLLIDRTEAVRGRLTASNNQHLQVLPVIVTSKTRMEVRADLEQAEKLGILVVTKSDLAEGLNRTIVRQDPDGIFDDALEQIRAAAAKHNQQPNLPGV